MLEAGGCEVDPRATAARNLFKINIQMFIETCFFIIVRPIVDVGDSLGLFAGDSALSQGDTGGPRALVEAHRVLGRQAAPVSLGGHPDRGQEEERGDQPRHHQENWTLREPRHD